ncbi:HotDog domain-containing protein [Dissophora ornata]|nr:HotDog domain-containing protein [Dissophora ornata]
MEEVKRSVLLEKEIQDLALVHEYKGMVKEGQWKQADPFWYLTKVTERHHLLAGSLRGENMLSVTPLKFERKDKKAIVLFMHLGRSLCGHDGIIHGGLLATVLGTSLMRGALPNLPYHIGFTANLNINYRKPVKADQFVMVKAEFERSEGRKGYTVASIQDVHGNILVECTALFISPKNPVAMVANYVKNSLGL